jgi:hypothetical protein
MEDPKPDTKPPGVPGEDRREPYVPPAVTWVEPLGHQATLIAGCGKQVGGDGACLTEPTS